jgi:small subunit ribosomal protein S5
MNIEPKLFQEKIIKIKRVIKVVKGGRQASFSVIVAVGDASGNAGVGFAKSKEVLFAIEKAIIHAKKNMFKVPISIENTFPKNTFFKYRNIKYIITCSKRSLGINTSKYIKPFLICAGYKNINVKIIGTRNPINSLKGLIFGLKNYKNIYKN